MQLREYVSFSADETMCLVDREEHNDGNAFARAWFPEGVKFEETVVSSGGSILFHRSSRSTMANIVSFLSCN
jgi:hypothetical protein